MIRWGIVGTGMIARRFAEAVNKMEDREITVWGAASRSYANAYRFCIEHQVPQAYENYDDMLASKDIDAVYIAVPHPWHCEYAAKAICAGKHVLCEKPMAMNSEQVQYLIDLAYDHNVFLMENMWTRFLPVTKQVRRWIEEGDIGEVRMMITNYGFIARGFPDSRWFNKELGGGALLDIGVYPISYTTMLMGFDIDEIQTCAYIGETGVDEHHNIWMRYRGGRFVSSISCSVVDEFGSDMIISGEYGKIEVDSFQKSERARLYRNGREPEEICLPHMVNGFEYSIREACHCIELGEIENPRLPWVVTLGNMKIMDDIRRKWGLRYPCE